jgi:spore coat-associated protein S
VEKNQLDLPKNLLTSMYPFQINNVELVRLKKGRGVWRVDTDEGIMYFKKLPRKERDVKFIIAAVEYMRKKGFHFPKIYKAVNGEMYVKYEEDCYLLMEEIKGGIPDYKSSEHLKKIITELAHFHRSSKGFNKYMECSGWKKMNKWERFFQQNGPFMETFMESKSNLVKKGLNKKEWRQLEKTLRKIKSQDFTKGRSVYLEWAERNQKNGGLCHYDYNRWNLRLTSSNELFLLDFDTIAVDLPLTDLKNFLYSFLRIEGEAGVKYFYPMLTWYHEINPLSFEEWSVLKKWLLYPHNIVILCKRYESNEKNEDQELQFLHDLKTLLNVEMLFDDVLAKFEKKLTKIIRLKDK